MELKNFKVLILKKNIKLKKIKSINGKNKNN
jgi:hypothetical protein